MRWLLLKDLRLLRRSPLLVALLVLYPIVIAVLIGFALSRGPDKPEVAFANLVPPSASQLNLGGERLDTSRQADVLFRAIEPVVVKSRAEAIRKVEDGDVLGAIVIPEDTTQKLQSGLDPATIEVFYNAEDPIKSRYVRDTIKSQVADANNALTKRLSKVALGFLELIATGGQYDFLGRQFDVLGLQRSERILKEARSELPAGSPARAQVDQVMRFARLARTNLDLSDDVLASVGTPIRVRQVRLDGAATPLSSFSVAIAVAVSIMFITLLLAAGALALEREENAFLRLVRGLVSRTGLLLEKAALAAVCSVAVCLLMLAGLGLFVDLQWDRFHLWAAGVTAGSLAFAAMGLAIGALTKEVRSASLLCVMLSLPLAFLALVPSGSVSPALFDAIGVISAVFPFKPTLDALNGALNDSGSLLGPLLHLAALFCAFGVASRLALQRFA
ncbi:MAG TPA: ABC transporter permease [Thermoleophilaceae bacterium]|nr:ABC transporter permease [Thermoleophilaceae bacterium]